MHTKLVQRIFLTLVLLFGLWLLAGCGSATPNLKATTMPMPTLTQPPTLTSTPLPNLTATITPTSEFHVGSALVSPIDGMRMMFIPSGEFMMGGNDYYPDVEKDEKPVHTVYLDAYWIDQTEVTNAEFAMFVDATGYLTDAEKNGSSNIYNSDHDQYEQVQGVNWLHLCGPGTPSGLENHPVVHVSWSDAQAYCEWRGGRLPTEAEWEKAAIWDDEKKETRNYPWGNGVDSSYANYSGSGKLWGDGGNSCLGNLADVGSYPLGASFYGLFDMAGNVWEWTADWYSDTYYSQSPYGNPKGPSSGTTRTLRGGSWLWSDFALLSKSRAIIEVPIASSTDIGFRCVQSASP